MVFSPAIALELLDHLPRRIMRRATTALAFAIGTKQHSGLCPFGLRLVQPVDQMAFMVRLAKVDFQPQLMRLIVETTGKPIRYAFDTHYHWDHTQGNSTLVDQGVTVICSQDCAAELKTIAAQLGAWPITASGTEGYRTAEVTLGGVDTDGLSSSTMMSKSVPGLYFIGEVVDVTGWLGGYNFQWAWASAAACGQAC